MGFETVCQCEQPTPMMLALSIHPTRADDLVRPDRLVTDPAVPVRAAKPPRLYSVASMFDAANLVAARCATSSAAMGRISKAEAGTDTSFLQTGEAKYGKPILDLAVTSSATLEDV